MEFDLIYKNMRLQEIKKAKNILENKIYTTVSTVEISYAKTKEPVAFHKKDALTYKPINIGESWGDLFDCAWFVVSGNVSKEYVKEDLYLRFDISGEALLYNEDGVPLKGFTNGSSVFDRQHGEPGKTTYRINDFINEDGDFVLWLDAGCNDLFGNYKDNGSVILAEISTKDLAIEKLYYDLETCIDTLLIYEEDSKEYKHVFEVLHQIYILIEYEEDHMMEKVAMLIKEVLNEKDDKRQTVTALGHAHLDLAWLWPIRETKRKLLRTLTNVFYLFEKYPDFKFGFSQPQLLEWLEKESPELFEKVAYYHKLGRLELQGGAWVEMDTNLSGEEAMIRQFLYGMNYYKEKFDFQPKSLWLPDVFGYSGNLPQMIKKCGLEYFMTIKISWNLINRFPYHTFNFEGIDDSQVLTHMPPEGNYNSSALAHTFKQSVEAYREKEIVDDSLLLFGIGDGGGGPGEEHMERIFRNKKLKDIPNIDIETSEVFFDKLAKDKEKYPVYKGELYLENHQGTFTSQSNIKKYNRHLEQLLKTVEYLLSMQMTFEYKEQIDRIWKEVLLYQFHDILPGSSIKRVYDETLERYHALESELHELIQTLTSNHLNLDLMNAPYLFNPLQINSTTYIQEDDIVRKIEIEAMTSNKIADETFELNEIPFTPFIENNLFTLKLDDAGEIKSFYRKDISKELVNQRNANALRVYKDTGDAWNINYIYREQTPKKLDLEEIKLFESKDFYQYVMTYRFKESVCIQTMNVFKNQYYIEIHHSLDWQNIGYMLRSSFDLNIQAKTAESDIQFGYISRSRLLETEVEQAMLEVPSQQWISISEDTIGAALLNTSKYGYYIKDDLLDINLLRSTNYPCENGDIGKTEYTYALYIHENDLNDVDLQAKKLNAAYIGLNKNLYRQKDFEWENQIIQLSTYKPAYDNRGFIVRFYNNSNTPQKTTLSFIHHYFDVFETNMIEKVEGDLGTLEALELDFKPFEVKTLKLMKGKVKGYFPKHIARAKKIINFTGRISHDETILLSSIQGILAKTKSRLYLSLSEAYEEWLSEIIAKEAEIVEMTRVEDVIEHFKDEIKGYVLYESETASQNIAASIAGVEGYILVEEKQQALCQPYSMEFIDARELDYAYMLEQYQEDLDFNIIVQQNPIYCGLYDLVALNAVFTSNVKTELIDHGIQLKKDTPILGWVPDDEVIGVSYLSSIDCNMIASNHSLNTTMFINKNKPVFKANNVAQKTIKDDKHYVTFVLSDGDNVQWMMGDYYQNIRTYGHPKRGAIPFAWSISPSMYDLAPEILELYYKNKTENDYFTSGVSGAGYMYPDQYTKEALETFLDHTEFYYKKLGIEYLAFLGTRLFDDDKSCLEAYAKRDVIKGGFLYANFDRYKGYNGKLFWVQDKPFISARFALWDYEHLEDLAVKINQGEVSPDTEAGYSMIVVHTWSHTYQDVMDLINLLDDHIEVLNADQFMKQLKDKVKR